MGLIIYLIVGGIIGWVASLIMKTDAQQGILLNVLVGIAGAFLGNILAGLVGGEGGISTAESFDIAKLLWSLLGAVILLGAINFFRRGRVR